MSASDDDGYDGPAELVLGDDTEGEVAVEGRVAVEVSMRGHFDPISGSYRWYGRVAASPAVAELIASHTRTVLLRTPHGQAETALSDVDPWGRPRVEGFGSAPFAVVSSLDAGGTE